MSKDRKKLLHIHSSVNDKQPTPATLELGELGVNNAKGNAFISTKNSDGEVVRFSEDETIIGWMEQKEVFPYEGYMRGADNSQVDGVTEQDLLDNKSNIIIKLNQVVPENTDYSPYDEKVNGAKDIYGNLINPIGSNEYKDGAGLAIDMSKYAMIGANPSFSSITTTCHATLNGTTEIKGKDDTCGSKFTVDVKDACIGANDTLNEYGANHSNFGTSCDGTSISNDTTLKGKKVLIASPSGDLTVDIQACNRISDMTNDFVVKECQDNAGKVEIDTTNITVSASTTDIKSCDRIKLESQNITLTDGDCGNGQITVETNDLCLVGTDKINVYGDKTNVGIDCDDSAVATNTRVFGKGTLITTKLAPNTYAAQNNIEVIADQDIAETATRNITEKASAISESASTSVSNTAPTLNYSGNTTNISGNTLVNINANGNGGDVAVHAKDDITVYADDLLCESGKTVTIFASNNGKLTIGGNSCEGNTGGTYPITYVRRPKNGVCEIKATTIDDALDEVLTRSKVKYSAATSSSHIDDVVPATGTSVVKSGSTTHTIWQDSGTCDNKLSFTVNDTVVSMSATTNPDGPSGETLTTYDLWQYIGGKKVEIGKINIPKDHLIEDVRVVYGTVTNNPSTGGQSFTTCSTVSSTCHWYIEMKWYVWDGSHTDKLTYIPVDDFIKDIDKNNTKADRGVNVDVWYDGKMNRVSADTTLNFATTNGDFKYEKKNGQHYESGTTLTFEEGSFSALTYQPWVTSKTVKVPTCVNHLNRHKITFQGGPTSGFSTSQTYDPGKDCANTAETINIPTCVNHLNRHKITFQSGSTASFNNQTYDPGKDCANTAETINIPTSLTHLKEWDGSCLNIPGCAKATNFYQTSDRNMKENIRLINPNQLSAASRIPILRFNFIDDPDKNEVFGIIAQDAENVGLHNIVVVDKDGRKAVDYTSISMLKIAYLERENKILKASLGRIKERLEKLENKD